MATFVRLLAVVLLGAATAMAGSITSITVYQNIPNSTNAADPANYASTLKWANIPSVAINFGTNSSDSTPIAVFLNTAPGDFSNLHNGFDPNATTSDNIELVITGTLTLNAGANSFVIGHDDGEVMSMPALGTLTCGTITGVITNGCNPGPQGFNTTPFTVTAPNAGDYAFTLYYNECCDGPADLLFQVNSQTIGGNTVPEPGSMFLLGSGLVAVATKVRKRRN